MKRLQHGRSVLQILTSLLPEKGYSSVSTSRRRTREIVRQVKPEEFKQKVDPLSLQKVMDEGTLLPEAIEILNYWSKRTIAGLLLMPPTRHNFLHLNEALRIKQRLQ